MAKAVQDNIVTYGNMNSEDVDIFQEGNPDLSLRKYSGGLVIRDLGKEYSDEPNSVEFTVSGLPTDSEWWVYDANTMKLIRSSGWNVHFEELRKMVWLNYARK